MGDKTDKSKNFRDNLKNILLILSFVTSIFAILFNVFVFPTQINNFLEAVKRLFSLNVVQFSINLGNILVSTYFLLVFSFSKKLSGNYQLREGKEFNFCELAELDRHEKIETLPQKSKNSLEGFQKRVSALVIQYLWLIRFFAISFVFLYLTILIAPIDVSEQEEQVRYLTNYAIATNIFNFLGGTVVFLAFWVLYKKTLNENDEDNRFWLIPTFLAALYIVFFVYLSWKFKLGDDAYYFLNIFDLIAGSVNGLAMFLLFGRYVSLEQALRGTYLFKDAFKDLFKSLPLFKSEKSYTHIISFGIIFVLPIYALAQPLFGSLQIPLYGDVMVFQTTVYGICLVGKICFFHLTYLLISKKLLHLYLYGLISEVGNFRKLEKCLVATETYTRLSNEPTQIENTDFINCPQQLLTDQQKLHLTSSKPPDSHQRKNGKSKYYLKGKM